MNYTIDGKHVHPCLLLRADLGHHTMCHGCGEVKDMTREQLVKKATAIAKKHFDEVGLETFRIAIKSEQCFDSDIEDFIESWKEGDGWSASTFLTTACSY